MIPDNKRNALPLIDLNVFKSVCFLSLRLYNIVSLKLMYVNLSKTVELVYENYRLQICPLYGNTEKNTKHDVYILYLEFIVTYAT